MEISLLLNLMLFGRREDYTDAITSFWNSFAFFFRLDNASFNAFLGSILLV